MMTISEWGANIYFFPKPPNSHVALSLSVEEQKQARASSASL